MLAKDLIDRLERRGLLDQEIIEALREQLAQSGARVTPEAVAKLLVDNGQLTRFQATKLIGELRDGEYPDDSGDVAVIDAGDDLALIDGDDAAVVEVFDDDAVMVDEDALSAGQGAGGNAFAASGGGSGQVATITDGDAGMPASGTRKVNVGKKVRDPAVSIWDSFKIYGIAALLLVLLFFGAALYFVLSKGNADETIAQANKAYDQQSYAGAQKSFESFLENFGQANQHSSIARTRLAMCELYQYAQFSDPTRATKEAERILPAIENEEGLEEERNNLAALLVDVADNIAKAAGEAKETTEKQQLLADLDRQIKLMENPSYVTSTARQALATRLLGVSETRARVQRDINRNLRLDESVASMKASLEAKDTKKAYDTRIALLREYPELRNDSRLTELIQSASKIQFELVKTSRELPEVSTEPLATDSVKNIVLTSRSGEASPGLRDEIVYMRVHGSILAFNAADGKLLWRRYVGMGQDYAPAPVDPSGREGVLLCDSQALEVQRTDGQDGSIRWRAKIGEPFSLPISQRGDIFLTTTSGKLISLDAESGEPRWVTQIPQPLEESPGVSERPAVLYLTGDHSNLYVLDKRNGKCSESYYIGHGKGTIAVPPLTLQGPDGGHVFVFENAGIDFALMHVLKCDAQGGGLAIAQPPFRLEGNVMVPPVMVLGRRLIVLTDRGEISVYDVEQSAKTSEQVSRTAHQVASYDRATSTQMAVGKNQMWVTGTRIGRFELQVSTGRIPRDWVNHEGDAFITAPVLIEDTLIHARVLRGTSGVRVTAADPVSGRAYWQTDVGVPVALLTPRPDGKGFYAISSQATLYELDGQTLAAGATSGPIENPGGLGVAMRFENPTWIDEQRAVMLNQESGGQICVLDPSRAREKLRLMTLAITPARAGGRGVIVGDGYMLPLNSGRIVLMDWQTGRALGSPFQPPSEPDKLVRWTDPVVLTGEDGQVVIADDRKKMYRLRVGEQIRELAAVDLKENLLGPMAGVGDSIIATAGGASADLLLTFDTATLEESARVLLDGRVSWGPFAAGDLAVLQTDDGMLRGYDASGKAAMTPVMLLKGELVRNVKLINGSLLVASRAGWIAMIDPASGMMTGKTDLNQPLSALPLEVGKGLLVPGAEGIVYITTIPNSVDEQ